MFHCFKTWFDACIMTSHRCSFCSSSRLQTAYVASGNSKLIFEWTINEHSVLFCIKGFQLTSTRMCHVVQHFKSKSYKLNNMANENIATHRGGRTGRKTSGCIGATDYWLQSTKVMFQQARQRHCNSYICMTWWKDNF